MQRTAIRLVSFLILIIAFQLRGQSFEEQLSPNPGNFLNSYWQDFKYLSTTTFSPAEFKNMQIVGYSSLAAVLLLGSDMEFNEEFGIERESGPLGLPKIMGDLGHFYDKPGTLYFTVGLAGTMFGAGKIFRNYKLQQTTGLMARSLIFTGIFTTALKVLIGRARPYVDNDAHQFKPLNFQFNPDYMSMPSGHTSSIFAMMTVLAKQYDNWYVKIPAYSFAVSVAMQRMNSQKHWGSDLLIGGTIGYLIGSSVVSRHNWKKGAMNIQPVFNNHGVGLAIQF